MTSPSKTSPTKGERRAVLATIAVLGVVPVMTGTNAILFGTARLPGVGGPNADGPTADGPTADGLTACPPDSTIDSEYRFVNVFWLAAGVVLWWSLRAPDARASVTRLVLGLAAAGGVPRLLSWRVTGAPHPVFRGVLVLELVIVPLVLLWHRRVLGGAR